VIWRWCGGARTTVNNLHPIWRGHAALKSDAPVIESFGVRGFGAHSNDAEYINIDSIEPRLYLLTRMVMDVAQGKAE